MASSRDLDQHDSLRLRPSNSQDSSPLLCSNNCGFFGSSRTNNLCSVCYKQSLRSSAFSASPSAVRPLGEEPASEIPPLSPRPLPEKLVYSSPRRWAFSLPVVRPEELSHGAEAVSVAERLGVLRSSRIIESGDLLPEPQLHLSPVPLQASSSPVVEPSLSSPESSLFPAPEAPLSAGASSSQVDEPSLLSLALSVLSVSEAPISPRASSQTVLKPLPAPSASGALAGTDAKRSSNRCLSCRKRVSLGASFKCRCGDVFCSSHRFPDQHGCTFDIKAKDREAIAKGNPVVKADKLQGRI